MASQLGVGVLEMRAHGAGADTEGRSDLAGGECLRQQTEHSEFPLAQPLPIRIVGPRRQPELRHPIERSQQG